MKVKDHIEAIRGNIAKGQLSEAIDKLQFLSEKSSRLDDVILQKARLSDLNNLILRGGISYEDSNATRYQINKAVLDIVKELEFYLSEETIQSELKDSIEAFIEKFGLDEALLNEHLERTAENTYHCLWVNNNSNTDKIEIDLLAALDVQCETARDPYEAYRVLNEREPSVIVLDSLISLRDNENEALEFCEFLCRYPKFRSIPVILRSQLIQNKISQDHDYLLANPLPSNIANNFDARNPFVIRDLVEEVLLATGIRAERILANKDLSSSGFNQDEHTPGIDWGSSFLKNEMNRVLMEWKDYNLPKLKSSIEYFDKIEKELERINNTLSEGEKLYYVFKILNLDTSLIFTKKVRTKDNIWRYLDDLDAYLFVDLRLVNKVLKEFADDRPLLADFTKYLIQELGVSNVLISEYLFHLYGTY